tara:strand:+ start:168 stop:578 length:411 start_codon:yes stop_codon:yes gene_type:complete
MLINSNLFITTLNLVLIFVYFIFLYLKYVSINLENALILLLIFSLLIKLLVWYNYKFIIKKNLIDLFKNIFQKERFIMFIILILSNILPIYMIVQRKSLVINMIIENISFLFVFLFALVGGYFEFFILKRMNEDEK